MITEPRDSSPAIQTRLSERNIVELVSKLQELGLLEAGLLHSIQGKDYITPEQLCTEIREAVREAGGRLAVVELPLGSLHRPSYKMLGIK